MQRKLSMYERYSVTRSNLGYRHPITILVTYPDLPTDAFLARRIKELQEHFPLLRSKIFGRNTREPYFEQVTPWSFDDVVHKAPTTDPPTILASENARAAGMEDPPWHIGLFTGADNHLALSVDHAWLDGKGIFNLLGALLAPDISSLPYERIDQITRLEDTHDIRPGVGFIAGVVWKELVIPRLPTFIQSYLSPPAWPEKLLTHPAQCPPALSVIDLPTTLIPRLKEAGKKHQVDTIHPILLVSLAFALSQTINANTLTVQTPGAVRDTTLGHGYCTGGYINSAVVTVTMEDFWTKTQEVAQYLASSAGQRRALETMGSLSYIPDPEPIDGVTGWDLFFKDKMGRGMDSLGVSNMGRITLPPGAVDLIWSQAASPMGPGIEVNVVGHDNGLRVTFVWREGVVLQRQEVDEVERVWRGLLDDIATLNRD